MLDLILYILLGSIDPMCGYWHIDLVHVPMSTTVILKLGLNIRRCVIHLSVCMYDCSTLLVHDVLFTTLLFCITREFEFPKNALIGWFCSLCMRLPAVHYIEIVYKNAHFVWFTRNAVVQDHWSSGQMTCPTYNILSLSLGNDWGGNRFIIHSHCVALHVFQIHLFA